MCFSGATKQESCTRRRSVSDVTHLERASSDWAWRRGMNVSTFCDADAYNEARIFDPAEANATDEVIRRVRMCALRGNAPAGAKQRRGKLSRCEEFRRRGVPDVQARSGARSMRLEDRGTERRRILHFDAKAISPRR